MNDKRLIAGGVINTCECGCGAYPGVYTRTRRERNAIAGTLRRFAVNHSVRVAGEETRFAFSPESRSERTGRWRAQKIKHGLGCELAHVGGCSKGLDRHHADRNPLNNSEENVWVLCRSHHMLAERGRIDLSDPAMPEFYIDAGGTRRYVRGGTGLA